MMSSLSGGCGSGSGSMEDLSAAEPLSYNQKNVKKWEKDEPLGDMATITPVLYCNLQHPALMEQYPGIGGLGTISRYRESRNNIQVPGD